MKLPRPFRRNSATPPSSQAEKAEEIIRNYAENAGYAGVPGAVLPHIDLFALIPMWARMTWRLAKCYNLTISPRDCLKIGAAIAGSAATFYGGVKIAGWYFSLTGVGVVPVAAMNATLNASLTYAAGRSIAGIFARNDLDPRDLVAVIIRELSKIFPTIGVRWPGGAAGAA